MIAISQLEFKARQFSHVALAGGGNRCWWQAGFLDIFLSQVTAKPRQLIGASAGAAIATAVVTNRVRQSLEAASLRFEQTARNFEWRWLLRGERPFAMPRIYPEWIQTFLSASEWPLFKSSPIKVDVVITRPLSGLPVSFSTLLALGLYATEKFWLKNFHTRLPHWLGLRAEHLDLSQAKDLETAHAYLLATAAAVPITPVHRVHDRPALDGGFYDSVPLPKDRQCDQYTLVLLTRHHPSKPNVFELDRRIYVQPSAPVAAKNFDCTDGVSIRSTYLQGQQDARVLLGC